LEVARNGAVKPVKEEARALRKKNFKNACSGPRNNATQERDAARKGAWGGEKHQQGIIGGGRRN